MALLMTFVSIFFYVLFIYGLALSFGQSGSTSSANLSQSIIYGVLALIFTGISVSLERSTKKEDSKDISEKLSSLEDMLEKGRISHDEFEIAKNELFEKNASES